MASFTTPALAQESAEAADSGAFSVSGGATIASDYRFRGISLSDENVAFQGDIEIEHESGAYIGAWASNLDGFGELGGADVELDLLAGYRTEITTGLTIDAGVTYYAYPGSSGGDFEFFEPYAKLGAEVGPAAVTLGIAYALDQEAIGSEDNIYLSADGELPLGNTPFTLDGHIGYSDGETTLSPGGDYADWSLGASASWNVLTARIAYVGTDISAADIIAEDGTSDIVDDTVVFSLTASF